MGRGQAWLTGACGEGRVGEDMLSACGVPDSGRAGPSSSAEPVGVHLPPCGHTWRGPRDQRDTPGAPALRAPQMEPLVPSPESCSGPGERCFLRQPWLQWLLQLEHPGGGGEVGGRAPGGPSSIVQPDFLQGPGGSSRAWADSTVPPPAWAVSPPRAPPPGVGPRFFPRIPADDPRRTGPGWE